MLALSIDNVRLQQRLTEEQRVANWKDVTGSIAHTVGTILFEVKGDVKELRSHLSLLYKGNIGGDLDALFRELNNGISLAEKVLYNFRTFASPTPLRPLYIDLRDIVRDVFQPVHGDYPVDLSLPDPLPVFVDSFEMGNALREIRKNAQEAMAGVTDKPRLIRVTGSVTQSPTGLQPLAQLEIMDNGPGFSHDVKLRLFTPYFTTKNDGTGLGLAIARKVIAAHGGTLDADNGPVGGRGSSYIFL